MNIHCDVALTAQDVEGLHTVNNGICLASVLSSLEGLLSLCICALVCSVMIPVRGIDFFIESPRFTYLFTFSPSFLLFQYQNGSWY